MAAGGERKGRVEEKVVVLRGAVQKKQGAHRPMGGKLPEGGAVVKVDHRGKGEEALPPQTALWKKKGHAACPGKRVAPKRLRRGGGNGGRRKPRGEEHLL